MKRLFILIGILAISWSASAQITRIEYFWNTDPGFDNGTALPITSGDSVAAVFSFSTVGLLPGVHTLYIRVKDVQGRYSVASKKPVHIKPPVYPISAAEYFIDTDPGFGNGTAISITPGDSIQLTEIVPTGSLAYGLHTIYVRVRDANGEWSVFSKRMIHIQEPVYPIAEAEYFVDTDPGFGNGTAIAITPGDSIDIVPTINTASLTPGIHTVYIRVKNTVGDWSVFSKRLIHIQNPVPPQIVEAEYFVDTDPGFGNGTAIPVVAGDSVLGNFSVSTGSLSLGIHMVYVRVKDAEGQWSNFSKKLIYIDNPADDEIVAAEYFIDADPGIGNATAITITPGDSVVTGFSAPTNSLLIGPHWVYVRVQDAEGRWSVYSKDSFYVDNFNCSIYGNGEIEMTGDTCRGTQISFSDLTASNSGVNSNDFYREWDFFDDGSIDFTPDSIVNYTFNTTGTFTVKLTTYETANPICQEVIYKTFTIRRIDTTYSYPSICDGQTYPAGGGNQTTSNIYYDTYSNIYGCDSVHVTDLTVIPNIPAAVSISITDTNICSGITAVFTAMPVNGGTPYYTWKVNGITVGAGYSFQGYNPFGISTLGDEDTVTVEMLSSETCVTGNPATSNSIIMNVTPSVSASITIAVDTNNFCEGTTATFTVTNVTNEGSNPQYDWYVDNVLVQSGGTTFAGSTLVNGNFVRCFLTSDAVCVSNSPVSSTPIYMTVFAIAFPDVAIVPSTNNVCYGTSITLTAGTAYSGSNPNFQWFLNDTLVQNSASNIYTSDTLDNGDLVKCILTSDYQCRLADYDTSNTVPMDIIYSLPLSVSITESGNNICQGTGVMFTASAINGGSPNYEWFVNGTSVQNGGFFQYSSSTLNNNDSVWAVVTSSISCATNNPYTSNKIYMTVVQYDTVSVKIVESQDTICEGTNVIFTATAVNPGAAPTYLWKVNNFQLQSGASNIYSSASLANGSFVTCEVYGDHQCVTPNPAVSNSITMTVTDTLMPTALLSIPQTTICAGTNVSFTATLSNQGNNPTIEWLINSNVVQTGGLNFSSSALQDFDSVRVRLTSGYVCPIQNPVLSIPVVMTVLDSITPAVFVFHGPNPACPGNLISVFTSTSTGGASPTYQFRVNGNVVQNGTQTQYTSGSFSNGDVVQVIMTSNASCLSTATATSNRDTIVIDSIDTADIFIQITTPGSCTGDPITFEATPQNGGSNPIYTWRVNNVVFQSGSSNTFTSTALQNADVVTCEMNSSLSCASNNPAQSNPIDVQIASTLPTSVIIVPSGNNVCLGTPITFTAVPTNGGNAPTYVWRVDGNVVQTGANNQFMSSSLVNGAVVSVELTSSLSCANPTTATDDVTVNISASVTINRQAAICAGDSLFVGGAFQTANGTYRDTLFAGGCDTVIATQLAVVQVLTESRTVRICTGDSVFAGGEYQTTSGIYFDTLTASGGCDSVLITDLTVSTAFTSNRNLTICSGDSVFAGGEYQTTSGIYFDTTLTGIGCDSIVVTALTVIQALPVVSRAVNLCNGDSIFAGGDFQYSAGIYFDTLNSFRGCDSIVRTTIVILPTASSSRQITICDQDSIFAGGAFQNTSGIYYDTLTGANGCDSVITTNLTAVSSFFKSISAGICIGDSFYAEGAFQQSSGIYYDTLNSIGGCDSVIETNLSVVPFFFVPVLKNICFGQSFFVGGSNQTISGFYYDTLSARGGCDSIIETHLIVNTLPIVDFIGLNSNYCTADSPSILTGIPSTGTFSGTGIIGNTFHPSIAPVGGPYNIRYTYTDTLGCSSTRTRQVSVALSPTATISGLNVEYCVDNPAVNLTGTPSNGYFAGPGLNYNTFVPYFAGPGIHYITYIVPLSGCDAVSSQAIIIHPLPMVSIDNMDNSYCIDDSVVNIIGTPAGGVFTGVGVTVSQFSPADAGVGGPHTITYSFTDSNSCFNQAFHQAIIFAKPNAVFIGLKENYCLGDFAVMLNAVPTGGVYAGAGVNGNILLPDSAGVGLHQLTYSVTDANSCQADVVKNFEVHDLPALTLNNLAVTYCLNDGAVVLDPSPAGGTFSGTGIVLNVFEPLIAGAGGPYTVAYQYTDANGCSNSLTQSVSVNPLPVVQILGLNGYYSLEDNPVAMTGFPAGGIFTGTGVSGNEFDQSLAGLGFHVIIYNYTDTNGCQGNDKFFVQVGSVGIEESLFAGAINVYPNPFNDELNIYLTATKATSLKILLRDIVGKIVFEKEIETVTGQNDFSISFGKMIIDGVYTIELSSKDSVYQKRLIRVE